MIFYQFFHIKKANLVAFSWWNEFTTVAPLPGKTLLTHAGETYYYSPLLQQNHGHPRWMHALETELGVFCVYGMSCSSSIKTHALTKLQFLPASCKNIQFQIGATATCHLCNVCCLNFLQWWCFRDSSWLRFTSFWF